MQLFTASPAVAATTLPVLWTAGGLSAGLDSAGNAGRIATDDLGNVAVVSGPSGGRDLAVTSYTATGSFRWRSTVSPSVGNVRRRLGGGSAERRFLGGRSQPRLPRLSDGKHPGPVRLRRDTPVAGGPRGPRGAAGRRRGGNAYLAISSPGHPVAQVQPLRRPALGDGKPHGRPIHGHLLHCDVADVGPGRDRCGADGR